MLSYDIRHLSNNFDRNTISCQILLKSPKRFTFDSFYFLLLFIMNRINETVFLWMTVCNRNRGKFFDFLRKKINTSLLFNLSINCKSVIYNKNIFHSNDADWNFILNCSVIITLPSKSKSRIFDKIFNSEIFSHPELGKITYYQTINWFVD